MEKYRKGDFTPGPFYIRVCEKSLADDLNEDFTLPDYQPEIRRLLRVCVSLTPPARYVGGGNAELSGNALYDVLYVGDDGKLYSSHLNSTYSFTAPLDDAPDADPSAGVCVLAHISPDSVTGRVLAPRRLGIRTRLHADVSAFAEANHIESLSGLDSPSSLRRLTGEGECAHVVYACEESVPLGDEIIPEARDGEIRIIDTDGRVFISEATSANNCIVCRGELMVKIMLCREGGDDNVEILNRKLPFSREISADGVAPGCECRAWGSCSGVNVTVGDGRLLCEATISLEAEAVMRESFDYTRDIYSTASSTEGVYSERTLPQPIRCACGNFTHSAVFDAAANGIPADAEIIDVSGTASSGQIVSEKGRCQLSGEATYTVVYRNSDGYGSAELSEPFRFGLDIPAGTPEGVLSGASEQCMTSARARMDGERISLDSEIAVALRASRDATVRMLDEARFAPGTLPRGGECVVCYPDRGDTVWSVAKRYLADAERLASSNSVKVSGAPDSAESLAGVKFLII